MKKEFAKIIYEKGFFRYKGCNSEKMGNLALFLTDDVININGWKEWALDPTQDITGSNFARLEKKNGYILISDATSEQPDGGPYFKVSIEEFIKIIDQWEQFCKTHPKEILITRENGIIKMEGRN